MSDNSLFVLIVLAVFLISIVVSLGALPFLAYALSFFNKFFTRLETGNIKFVDAGGTLVKIIEDVRGFELDQNNLLVKSNQKKKRFFLFRWLGIYWIGFPPFRSIHKFKIVKEKENINAPNKDNWIINSGEVEVSELRSTFPRAYQFLDTELRAVDPVAVDILVSCKFEVVNPEKIVYQLKGDIFTNIFTILNSAVGDVLNKLTLDEFMDKPKSEFEGMLKHLKEENSLFNQSLIEQVGVRLVGISMRYDPANKELRAAMEKRGIEKELAQARRLQADGERDAQISLATGLKARVTALREGLGGDTNATAEVLKAEALAGKDSKITTLVQGGGLQPVLPITQNNKKTEGGDD